MTDIKSLLGQDRNAEGGTVENVVILVTKYYFTIKKNNSMLHVNKSLSSRRCEAEFPLVCLTGCAPQLTVADSQTYSHQMGVCKVFILL